MKRHDDEMEKLRERREQERHQQSPEGVEQRAVQAFNWRFRDVLADPLRRDLVAIRRQEILDKAARTGEVIDWQKTLTELGDETRENCGLPTAEDVTNALKGKIW